MLREQVTLQAKSRLTREERQRVWQREHDEVVRLIGTVQECPTVVDDPVNTGILIGMVGMELDADGHQLRIDLHRVDRLGAIGERGCHIVAVACPDHEDARRWMREAPVDQLVVGVASGGDRSLMRDPVRIDEGRRAAVPNLQTIVGGPDRVRGKCSDHEHREHRSDGDPLKHRRASVERNEERGDHETPRDRAQAGEPDGREDHDPRDRTQDVKAIRIERGEPGEPHGHAVRDRRHRHSRRDEDEGEHQPDRQPVDLNAEIHQVPARAVDRCREREHQTNEQGENDRSFSEEIRLLVGPKEPDPDAEEAAQQDEVGEIRKVDDIGAGPADQSQLNEEHQEGRQEQIDTVTGHGENLDRPRPDCYHPRFVPFPVGR